MKYYRLLLFWPMLISSCNPNGRESVPDSSIDPQSPLATEPEVKSDHAWRFCREPELWEQLANADWSSLPRDDPAEKNTVRLKSLVEDLACRDHAHAAARFHEMLARQPNSLLASWTAGYLAEHREYRAVPVLMRYAMLGSDACIKALDRMQVPQVAMPILYHIVAQEAVEQHLEARRRMDTNGLLSPPTVQLTRPQRRHVARILGADAGEDFRDWATLYSNVLPSLKTPLSHAQANETDRVVDAICKFAVAEGRAMLIRRDLAQGPALEDLRKAGFAEDAAVVLKYNARARTGAPLPMPSPGTRDFEAFARYGVCLQAACKRVRMPRRNLDVPGTDALEKEMDAYVEKLASWTSGALEPK